jgi:hypothetical protein
MDVLVGMAIGFLTVVLVWGSWRNQEELWRRLWSRLRVLHLQALGILFGVGLWLLLFPGHLDPVTCSAGGALLGITVGCIYQSSWFDFAPPSGIWRRLVAGVLGLAVAFGLRVGLKAGFAALGFEPPLADIVRYAALGSWIALAAPWFFVLLGLARRPAPGVRLTAVR